MPEVRGQLGQAEPFAGLLAAGTNGVAARVPARRTPIHSVGGSLVSPSGRCTIYTNEPPPTRSARRAAPVVTCSRRRTPPNAPTITITAAQLRGLRDGQDTIVSEGSNQISVVPHRSILLQSFLVGIRSTGLRFCTPGTRRFTLT